MKPHSIGRTLGIGLRVAGRIVGQQVAANAQPTGHSSPRVAVSSAVNKDAVRAAGQKAGRTSRGVARGLGGFFRPFRRIGGILWLEVTGVFFFLPVLVFGPTLWRYRASYAHGPNHRDFLIAAVIVVLFFYLSVSSFWRARKR